MMKKRMVMKEKSFSEALRWGLISSLSCMTVGLLSLTQKIRQQYASHDYLYVEFVRIKDQSAISLLSRIQEPVEIEESLPKAA